MNVFSRFMVFLNKLFGRKEKEFSPTEFIRQQKQSLKNLRSTLTELIFQRKKFEARIKALEIEKDQLQVDMETAARQDRDDLAIHLMDQLEEISDELDSSRGNFESVCDEIAQAKEMEKELERQIEKSQSQVAVLMSRMESVKMREKMQGEFNRVQREVMGMRPGLSEIETNILKMEAKMETIQGKEPQHSKELRKFRKERASQKRHAELVTLKAKVKEKQSLPASTYINSNLVTQQ